MNKMIRYSSLLIFTCTLPISLAAVDPTLNPLEIPSTEYVFYTQACDAFVATHQHAIRPHLDKIITLIRTYKQTDSEQSCEILNDLCATPNGSQLIYDYATFAHDTIASFLERRLFLGGVDTESPTYGTQSNYFNALMLQSLRNLKDTIISSSQPWPERFYQEAAKTFVAKISPVFYVNTGDGAGTMVRSNQPQKQRSLIHPLSQLLQLYRHQATLDPLQALSCRNLHGAIGTLAAKDRYSRSSLCSFDGLIVEVMSATLSKKAKIFPKKSFSDVKFIQSCGRVFLENSFPSVTYAQEQAYYGQHPLDDEEVRKTYLHEVPKITMAVITELAKK